MQIYNFSYISLQKQDDISVNSCTPVNNLINENSADIENIVSLENALPKSQKRKHDGVGKADNEKEQIQKKKNKHQSEFVNIELPQDMTENGDAIEIDERNEKFIIKQKKKKKHNNGNSFNSFVNKESSKNSTKNSVFNNKEEDVSMKKKHVYKNYNRVNSNERTEKLNETEGKEVIEKKKNKKMKKQQNNNVPNNGMKTETSTGDQADQEKKESSKLLKWKKKKEVRQKRLAKKQKYQELKKKLDKKNKLSKQDSKERNSSELEALSADRLKAFGTNPKKFKNKLKYRNKE